MPKKFKEYKKLKDKTKFIFHKNFCEAMSINSKDIAKRSELRKEIEMHLDDLSDEELEELYIEKNNPMIKALNILVQRKLNKINNL